MTMKSLIQEAQIVCSANSLEASGRPVGFQSRNRTKTIFQSDEAILKRESSMQSNGQSRASWRSNMAAVAKLLSDGFAATGFDAELPRTIVLLCAVALTVFSLITSYGIDLSSGFF
jgi:hypothetical protein